MVFPFFMVKIAYFDEMTLKKKTFFLGSFNQLQPLINMEESGDIAIVNLYIVCPKHISGGDEWEMHKLIKIYRGMEPKYSEQSCYVYEIAGNKKLVESMLGTNISEISEFNLLYAFE